MPNFYPYSTQLIDESDKKALLSALESTHLTQGQRVVEFEKALAEFCGVKYALCLNSATSALYVAYHWFKAQNLDSQIYAITTPISFVATCNMMLANAITPLFAEVLPNGNINPKSVREILNTHKNKESIKLLVSVDYAGLSVEGEELEKIAQEFNLVWISDSSHAFGASYKGAKIGSLAHASIFSFHAIKPITTAEGGALLTNDESLYAHAQAMLSHGIIKGRAWNYDCIDIGFNFRMNELSAALGLSQLPKIKRFISVREEIARFYDEIFAKNPYFSTIARPSYMQSSHHLYPILLFPSLWCAKEDIFNALLTQGIGAQVHYKPIYQFSLYKRLFGEMRLESAESFYLSELSIPCAQNMSIKDAKEVAHILLEVLESSACAR
ncbi:UDP-4-amino-4,6-dideoxy-N-acetyl-beta-L-altrosamine transaminase [Helicobacter himalayensis]|uniref:UDP-4-amino-4, 6-dideoxy-N-acetyl-beta-L-altrosamine transaminase n=1 Tax=Helicobacter himalayensis TaxID=1591088 RepID=UPI003D6EB85B